MSRAAILYLAALLAACTSAPTERSASVVEPLSESTPASPPAIQAAVMRKPLAGVFTPGEREVRHDLRHLSLLDKNDARLLSYLREGEYQGLPYSILLNSNRELINGSVDGPKTAAGGASDDPDRWVVLTDVDAMTDRRSWRIVHHRTRLSIQMSAPGEPTHACLSRADFPGRPFSIRVGLNNALTFTADTCSTEHLRTLFNQMMVGGAFLTRAYEWPYDYPKDKDGEADTFKAAHDLFAHMYDLVRTGTANQL